MDPLYEVRTATHGDLATVAALSCAWAAEGITRGLAPNSVELLRERLGGTFGVASFGDRIIGYAFGRVRSDLEQAVFPQGFPVFEVEEAYVTPTHRSRGVGSALLDLVLAAARAEGVNHFTVYSATKSIDSIIRFYAARGFQPWSVQLYRSE